MIFKIGDKVKCIEKQGIDINIDEVYTIYKVNKRNNIEFIYLEETKTFIGYLARAFELVK